MVVAEHDTRHVGPTGLSEPVRFPSTVISPTSPLHTFANGHTIMQFGYAIDRFQYTSRRDELITEIAQHGT
jgi:hypothetical protein